MHGASYVELERAVGPEGSASERVSRFVFCSVGPGTSKREDGGKRLLFRLVLCFCVSGSDDCNTHQVVIILIFLNKPETQSQQCRTECRILILSNLLFIECIFHVF